MNITFQRSNERAPVYELPPMANTIKKNVSNMNTQCSPGFDPFSASFIKHAEETVRDDRGKSHTENVLLPLLTDLFHLLLSDWGAMYEHLRVVPPGKRLRVPSCTRPEILGSG